MAAAGRSRAVKRQDDKKPVGRDEGRGPSGELKGDGQPSPGASWYRLAFEASPTPSFELRPDLSVHRLNASGRNLFNRFGVNEFEELLEPTVCDEFRTQTNKVFSGELGEFRMECTLKRFPKRPVPYLINVARVDLRGGGASALVFLVDLTERKRAEECWHRVERIARVGSWDWDVATGRVDWSEQVYELFGVEKHEFDGRFETFLEYVHPEDRRRVDEALRSAFDENEPFELDHRVRGPEGQVLHVQESAEIERDTQGRPTRMHGAIIDITERKKAEEALRRSELSFRKLFEFAPIGLWLIDADGTIVRGNPAGRKIWGGIRKVTPEHYDQYEAWFLDSGRKLDSEDWAGYRAMRTGEPALGQRIRIRRFDGQERIIENSAVPLKDDSGAIIGGLVTNRDITDQVQASEALADSERRFRQIFDSAPVGMAVVDSDFRFLRVNQALCEMLDYPASELLSKSIADITYPDDINESVRQIERLFNGEIPQYRIEKRYLTRLGEPVWVEIGVTLIRETPGGRPRLAIGVVADVDVRRKAVEELRRSEEHFRLMFENVKEYALFTVDRDGRITSWNPGGESLYGYRREEILNRPEIILHVPEEVEMGVHERAMEAALVEGRFEGEMWCLRKDKSRFYAHTVIRAMRTPDGDVSGFLVIRRDVSSFKRLEEQRSRWLEREQHARSLAEETRNRMELLFRTTTALFEQPHTVEGIAQKLMTLLVPGVADCCIVDLLDRDSRAVRRRIHCQLEARRRRILNEIERRYPPTLDDPIGPGGVMRNGTSEYAELVPEPMLRAYARDPEHLEMLLALGIHSYLVVPVRIDGACRGALTLVSMTESRRFDTQDVALAQELAYRFGLAVSQARLVRKLEQAVTSRENIVAFVSHDLKNPLMSISLTAGWISRRSEDCEDPEKVSEMARHIQHSARNMNRLISDVLDLSKLEAGEFKVTPEICPIQNIVQDVMSIMRPIAEEKGLRFEADIEADLPDLYCDRVQSQRVLGNLVGNAIKFTEEGSVEVRVRREGERVRFEVIDTGPGIDSAAIPHIFNRYWQERERRRKGTGLGLAIAKGIVEAHGGRIWADSGISQGARFYFTLPVDHSDPRGESKQAA